MAYFLPPVDSRLAKEWDRQDSGHSQRIFSECCVHGINTIAKQLASAIDDNQELPSIYDLYRQAAQVRFQTAIVSPHTDKSYNILYGAPNFGETVAHIIPEPKGRIRVARWEDKYPQIKALFDEIVDKHPDASAIENLLGPGIIATVDNDWGFVVTDAGNRKDGTKRFQAVNIWGIDQAGNPHRLYSMRHPPDAEEIHLLRMPFQDRDYAFTEADRLLRRMKSDADREDTETFRRDFADLAAVLHRASPCVLGGQATTMMVLGGIGKAFGWPPSPAEAKFDHAMDACLMTRAEYQEHFQKFFPEKATSAGAVKHIPVNEGFFDQARFSREWQDYSKTVDTPQKRDKALEQLLTWFYDEPFPNFKVNELSVSNYNKLTLRVQPPEAQERANYLLNWWKDAVVAKAIGLQREQGAILSMDTATLEPVEAIRGLLAPYREELLQHGLGPDVIEDARAALQRHVMAGGNQAMQIDVATLQIGQPLNPALNAHKIAAGITLLPSDGEPPRPGSTPSSSTPPAPHQRK